MNKMDKKELFEQVKKKKSYLCVGLDSQYEKIPDHLKGKHDSIFIFNKAIIDQTHDLSIAYKINTAFYEARGKDGWEMLNQTAEYIKTKYPEIFLIADAKRGDIGNTANMYARAFFEEMNFDAVTVAPYMGRDSVEPFLQYPQKWVILLGLTSNNGAFDFQFFYSEKEKQYLYEKVINTAQEWGTEDNMMFVVGATKGEQLESIRKLIPNHFMLVPGVGAQGGSLEEVSNRAMNEQCGLLINSSRGIIFADQTETFAETARLKATELQNNMQRLLHL
jgi:orotidine-5'-phosphate decarboxylase